MSGTLSIVGLGAVTPVGLTAAQTCAAIRARISGVREVAVRPPDFEPVSGAAVPARSALKQSRDEWLVNLALRAVREALAREAPPPARTALLLALPAPGRAQGNGSLSGQAWVSAVERRLGLRFHPSSAAFPEGHAALVPALTRARELLASGQVSHALVAGVDSMVNDVDIDRLAGWNRLYGPDNAQGVIPGEGAACVLVTAPGAGRNAGVCDVLGFATDLEQDTVLGTRTSVGDGLLRALRKAQADAGAAEPDVHFRVCDMNGERYRGLESMLAESRYYRTRRVRFEVIYPAASVADVGAAAGPLCLVVAAVSMAKGYAPGTCAMIECSSEEGLRGACLVRRPRDLPQPEEDGIAERLWGLPPAAGGGSPAESPVIPEVQSQHAEEAAFLWEQRRAATRQPHFSLDDLAALEERLEAHLDGLREAGTAGWTACEAALETPAAGEFFAAAVTAFASGRRERADIVLAKLADAPGAAPGVASALAWLPPTHAEPLAARLARATEPALRYVLLASAAVNRDPRVHALLPAATAADADPRLWVRALRAAGELRRKEIGLELRAALAAPDVETRFWAAWSTCLLPGDAAPALATLLAIAESPSPLAARAADVLGRRMDAEAVLAWCKKAQPRQARAALAAAAALGRIELMPWIFELMKRPALARPAGEALATLTGADLVTLKLDAKPPENFEAGPSEDPADENVQIDTDLDLPWPDVARVAGWWESQAGRYLPGTRYLMGNAITVDWMQEVLRHGRQRQRAAAALELAMLNPTEPLFEVRAPASRQRRLLGMLAGRT